MNEFTDKLGREWRLDITVGSAADVEAVSGVDLLRCVQDGEALTSLLYTDPRRLVKVLGAILSEDMAAGNVSPDSFARGFDGATMERASEALLGAICDFFPRSRVAKALKASLTRALTDADDRAIQEIEARGFSNSPGSSPESPASTPAPSP